MLTEFLNKTKLFQLLYLIDLEFASNMKKQTCEHCNSNLHQSNYQRKLAGGPDNLPDEYMKRFSFCCCKEGCRSRAMPASVRFLDRKEHWACVILIVITLKNNRTNGYTAYKLMQKFDISHSTLLRWAKYFREVFPSSQQWKALRGRIDASISNESLPGNLICFFIKSSKTTELGVIKCLLFLATGSIIDFDN